jgi:hypothetical protein
MPQEKTETLLEAGRDVGQETDAEKTELRTEPQYKDS